MEPHIWIWVWVLLAAILAVAEFFTGGYFILPFAVGAALAALLELVRPGSIDAQWIAFLGVSSVMLVVIRRTIARRERETAADEQL